MYKTDGMTKYFHILMSLLRGDFVIEEVFPLKCEKYSLKKTN